MLIMGAGRVLKGLFFFFHPTMNKIKVRKNIISMICSSWGAEQATQLFTNPTEGPQRLNAPLHGEFIFQKFIVFDHSCLFSLKNIVSRD